MPFSRCHCQKQPRGAFTLIEVTVSTMLVGFLLVASLESVGQTLLARQMMADQALAATMTQELMTEILAKTYEDAVAPTFGPEAGENSRRQYDDVDDYYGWSSSPPKDREDVTYLSRTGWSRSVTVEWIDPASPTTVSGSDLDLKRITISVQRNGQTLAQLSALKRRE